MLVFADKNIFLDIFPWPNFLSSTLYACWVENGICFFQGRLYLCSSTGFPGLEGERGWEGLPGLPGEKGAPSFPGQSCLSSNLLSFHQCH